MVECGTHDHGDAPSDHGDISRNKIKGACIFEKYTSKGKKEHQGGVIAQYLH